MQRTFTVPLSVEEASTVWRMAEVTGVPAAISTRAAILRTAAASELEIVPTLVVR